MAKNQKKLVESALADESGGRLSGFLADEGAFDRRTLLRLGSWGISSIAAMTIAILAHQSGNEHRKESGAALGQEQVAAADLARQSRQFQSFAKASENEISRMSSAINTLNNDRDRLFARVTVLEQGLDSVTGSISQNVEQKGFRLARSENDAAPGSLPAEAPLLPPPDLALPAKRLDPSRQSEASSSLSTAGRSSAAVLRPTPVAMAETAAKPLPSDASSANFLSANTPASTSPHANSSSTSAPPAADSSTGTAPPITPRVASQPATITHDLPATTSGVPDETAAVTPAMTKTKKDRELHKHKDADNKDAQIVVAPLPAASAAPPVPSAPAHIPVAHTDFGVDLGSANSIKGLRALWRSVLKSEAKELTSLHPVIVVKERGNGIGMQLRLVAGPLADAAAAARICAVLSENGRTCETAVFEGQRLATNEDGKVTDAVTAKKPRAAHASSRHRHSGKPARAEEPAPPPPPTPPPPQPSTSGSFFSH